MFFFGAAFAQVIKELWSEDALDRVVNTVALKSQIQRFAPRFMGYAQQDAQEFLRYLLEGLHEDVNRVTEKPRPILTEIDEKLRLVAIFLAVALNCVVWVKVTSVFRGWKVKISVPELYKCLYDF